MLMNYYKGENTLYLTFVEQSLSSWRNTDLPGALFSFFFCIYQNIDLYEKSHLSRYVQEQENARPPQI